ncbi:MoaC-domain-containing protein [Jaminaea rosea]|uniref:cyclic pyranopterin monophosphate synthase n=1 Tax=Jaminaea rosea TaxID=1569628 RepID=A0A316ULB0_9BASI|nr:MoaC-domain-containing protein [Jaminaea rosea]PWN26029.1 MoaC-domain-containing protein [Jaminaea rosea]
MPRLSHAATPSRRRLFHTSSLLQRSSPEDEDVNPWAELDESVEGWSEKATRASPASPASPSSSPDSANAISSSVDGQDLSAEERMLLQAFTSKLDRLSGDQPPTKAAQAMNSTSYSPTPRIHHPPPAAQQQRYSEAMTEASASQPRLTHLDPTTSQPRMVDVSSKPSTNRTATAMGKVFLPLHVLPLLDGASSSDGEIASPAGKGPVFSTARLSGILAAKRTAELIPLCHTVPLDNVDLSFSLVLPPGYDFDPEELPPRPHVLIEATCSTRGPTGVEMEALTAVSVAACTAWDMLKSVAGREMEVGEIAVVRKSGGKSGDWVRDV